MGIIKKFDIRKIRRYKINITRLEKIGEKTELTPLEQKCLQYYKDEMRRLQNILNMKRKE